MIMSEEEENISGIDKWEEFSRILNFMIAAIPQNLHF